MKRRIFLTAASTVGIVGVASSATVVSSVYNNLSVSVLLEEFDVPSKNILNKFVSDIAENTAALGLDSNLAKRLAMPVHIIKNEKLNGHQSLIYKNKAGQTISLSEGFKNEKVVILKTA